MQIWEATYKGHEIRIEHGILAKRLFIDGELHARHSGLVVDAELLTRIGRGNAIGEPVMAKLRGFWRLYCDLVINDVQIGLMKHVDKPAQQ